MNAINDCPPCRDGKHDDCYDGEKARENFENEAFFDGPVPWYWCTCDCEGGTLDLLRPTYDEVV